jgi:HK97 family phage portal protein
VMPAAPARRSWFGRLADALKGLGPPLQPNAPAGRAVGNFWGDGRTTAFLREGTLPGSNADYTAETGDLWLNSAVAACLTWLVDNLCEPVLTVTKTQADQDVPTYEHPLLDLIAKPNEEYDGETLLSASAVGYKVDGTAFWFKGRANGGTGPVRELWYVPREEMAPLPGGRWEHKAGGKREEWDAEDVLVLRYGMDPRNRRFGLAPLQSALREIAGDNRAATWCAALLRNWGVASTVIVNESEDGFADPDVVMGVLNKFRSVTGEKAGDPVFLEGKYSVHQLGISPKDMDPTTLRMIFEDRICSTVGVNAMTVGLTSGAAHKTYANYGEAIAASYRSGLVPMLNRWARLLTRDLGPEFGLAPDERLAWDYSAVQALQEARKDKVTNAVGAYQGGLATRNEGREELGYEPVDDGDLFVDEAAPPEPEATPTVDDVTPQMDELAGGDDEQAAAA